MITSCILFSKLKLSSFNFFKFLYPSNFFAIAFHRLFKFLFSPNTPSSFLFLQTPQNKFKSPFNLSIFHISNPYNFFSPPILVPLPKIFHFSPKLQKIIPSIQLFSIRLSKHSPYLKRTAILKKKSILITTNLAQKLHAFPDRAKRVQNIHR